ncbi:hypothetical protein [Fimbriiglobus ruber]|uniref:Molecular chaperone n=1 Tax=Fimbriiglobus ruber TaxID=1908690 RepID=A0A225D9X8_9BACT|nr:hypothetical protein [Fimbriiglobus ruber]OWK36464.1 hypothetical protein FRUB_09027 [Fimbriiglobus ruber]
MPLTLTLDDVYLRAGRVAKAFNVAGQFRPARPLDRLAEFGVLVHWPRAHDWLSLTARLLPGPGGPPAGTPFAADPAGLDAVCAKHAVARDQLAPPLFLKQNLYLVASLPAANQIELTAAVDTDAAGFRAFAAAHRDPAAGHVVVPIELRYFDGKQFKQYVDQPSRLDLACKPCRPLPRFVGVVAIDLGNTVSSVAALAESARVSESAAVSLVPLDRGGADPRLLVSAVRLDEVRPPAEAAGAAARRLPDLLADDPRATLRYAAGRAAVAGGGGPAESVVTGVKQLLSVPETSSGDPAAAAPCFALNVPLAAADGGPPQPEQLDVANHFPGELLFAHMFACFRAEARAWPGDVALTYPTTYTRGELKQLVSAAARGWLRTMLQPQALDREPSPTDDADLDLLVAQVRGWLNDPGRRTADCPLVRLAVDEATAAAFFHVHRRVFEQPGALTRFRYLQPDGSYALVVDCGGGTTDIVLARAYAPGAGAPGGLARNLRLDVLARTGLRGFGGDNMTREVCRLAKAKMTVLLAKLLQPATAAGITPPPAAGPADPPAATQVVRKFLEKTAALRPVGPADEYVPTRFDPKDLSADSLARRAAARSLWALGEELKRKLVDGKPVKFNQLSAEHLRKETSALIRLVLEGKPPAVQAQFAQQLGEVAVAPWEADALVRGPIESVVAKCNTLIAEKLRPDDTGTRPEVDWVVLSGNGARYPLVQRLLRERLHVAFLDFPGSERLTFDPDNLKHAVAKGAAMARMVSRVARTAAVQYESNLSERLPFDVGVHELHVAGTRRIFREFTPYSDLLTQTMELRMEKAPDGTPQTLMLDRRFPGDERWSQFAAYHFAHGSAGDVQIRYDDALSRFVVTADGEDSAYADPTDPLTHVSPQNVGDV